MSILRKSIYKSPAQMRLMVAPGLATAASLAAVRALIRPGVTTLELDAAAEAAIIARGGASNFKLESGYNHTICASVNDDVVHGIPNSRALEPGDIVSVDSGAVIDGWNGDAAFSFVVPDADPARAAVRAEREKWSHVTELSLWVGIAQLSRARHLNEVGEAIDAQLAGRDWIAGTRSIADPYVFVVTRWAKAMGVDLSGLGHVERFFNAMLADPGVHAALQQEGIA